MSQPAAATDRDDRLQTWIARAIVVVSILGAIVGWRASVWSGNAGGYDSQTAQDRILAEQAHAQSRSFAAEDLRLLGPTQAAYSSAVLLDRQADAAARRGRTGLADDLRVQARRARVEGATLQRFVTAAPFEVAPDGSLDYDVDAAIANGDAGQRDLVGLRPGETERLAEAARDKTSHLVLAAAVLVLSLFFLTLSQLGGPRRGVFAGGGLGVALMGAILFALA